MAKQRESTRRWELQADIGKLQPKAQRFTASVFYIDVTEGVVLEVGVRVFADNLPEPSVLRTSLRLDVQEADIDVEDVEKALAERQGG